MTERWQCNCGSGLAKRELLDAAGIFCTFVCDKCEREKRAGFRLEIFEAGTSYARSGEEEDLAGEDDDEDEEDVEEDVEDEETMRHRMFQDPGGNSALRRETATNPRNLPCPTCGEPNRLTPADRAAGYQCNTCADREEGP